MTAVIVKRRDTKLTTSGVIGLLKSTIAKLKVPKQVFFTDELPRNTMGKVQKNVLREKYAIAATSIRTSTEASGISSS